MSQQQLEALAEHIGKRFGEERRQMRDRVEALGAELAALRAELETLKRSLPLRAVSGQKAAA